MTASAWRIALLVVAVAVAALASACADEDLVVEKEPTGAPRSVVRVPGPLNVPGKAHPPLFYRAEVREGDTVDSVARMYGIRPEYLVWNNEGAMLDGELAARAGSWLDIPSVDAIIHHVRPGEALTEIAARYGVESQAIIDFPANGLSSPTSVLAGVLLVPGGRKP